MALWAWGRSRAWGRLVATTTVAAVAWWLLMAPATVRAAEDTPSAHFSANMTDLRSSLKAFAQTIETYNQSVKAVTDFDVDAAKAKVAEIKEQIKQLLDQLGDNSPLAKSQYELTRWIERNRRLVRTDPLLSAERKDLLEKAWSERADEIERAGVEIVAVRKALVEQLNKVVGDETFLTQLLFLEKANEAAALIKRFLNDIKSFSDSLRQRMDALPVPGPAS
jgi:translation initiation factor 2B subunit (eIF-2B alpha/beta/delta family)